MYTESDMAVVEKTAKKRGALLLVALIAFLVGAGGFLYLRNYALEVLWTCLALGFILFYFDNFYWPEKTYQKFLQEMLEGRRHEVVGVYDSEERGVKDGLSLRIWTMHDEEGEFIVYLDARKEWDAPEPGDRLRLQAHENYVLLYTKENSNA